jgi:hypothetical protein
MEMDKFTEKAMAARDGERDDDFVADLQLLYLGTDLHDLHELVTEDVAGFEGGHVAVV